MTTPSAELKMITLDCLDPKAAADFRAQLLGWDLAPSEDAHAMVTGPHARWPPTGADPPLPGDQDVLRDGMSGNAALRHGESS
ncbi:hypothetical protein BH18ACT7_BH18ACT7_04240 [soil metagenome]